MNKSVLVERIAEIVVSGKMPLIEDVRDVSTEDIRIDLHLRKDADEAKCWRISIRNTPLQTNFAVNITCLVPTENPEVGAPQRLGLKEVFCGTSCTSASKSLPIDCNKSSTIYFAACTSSKAFMIVFDALDEIIRIIRKSEGKADAADKIMKRFPAAKGGLDEEQTDAILELKLYRLARLEINIIAEELADKKKRAAQIQRLLKESTKIPCHQVGGRSFAARLKA